MDRFDLLELVGIALLVGFAFVVWPPAALLVAGLAALVEAQLRSLVAGEPAPVDGGDV